MKEFATKEQLFKYLKENKDILIAEKKSVMKKADCVSFCNVDFQDKEYAVKSDLITKELNENELQVKVVINTTNLLDSHKDVHINGIWKQTLKNRTKALHLQEHQLKFDYIISNDATPYVKTMSWQQLGYNYNGTTQALIFDSVVKLKRNAKMFENYREGYVENHSVGMQYVKLHLCINSTDRYYAEEKANFDKYIEYVANKDDFEEITYFWAVTEAKLIEGSAVPIGSNFATPTLSIKEIENINSDEPSDDTQKNSRENTIDKEEFRNYIKSLINN